MKKILIILMVLTVSLPLVLAQEEREEIQEREMLERELLERKPIVSQISNPDNVVSQSPAEQREVVANPQQQSSDPESSTITLELKNMDIVEVLKLLASKGGLDIVVSQNVRGRITLFLDDVPVWDAMQIIFETSALAYIEHEGILRIVTDREYEQQYGRKFHDRREVKIVPLQYAQAADVIRELKQLKSRIGNIIADDRTNSIILIDTPKSIEIMESAVSKLDVPVQTKIFTLKYTPVKSLEETLKKLISKKGTLHVDDYTNKIILSDTSDVIEQASLVVEEYDRPPYLETKIFTLSHGKFDTVEEKIKDMLTKDIGIIKSDERTNKIVITDLPEKIADVSRVIAAYDEPSRQVLIEAKIVQVALNDEYKMGINWQLILNSVWVSRIFGVDTIDLTLSQVFSTLSEIGTTDTDPFDNSVRASSPGGRSLVTGTLQEGHDFDAVINALKVAGKTNLLSSPRITAVNNQEARIQVGTREAFVTNTVVQSDTAATTAENVTFIDVGILLTVTPTIGEDNYITLKIKPEVSSVERTLTTAEGNQIPIVATQEAETTVMVKDGATIIMGGLIQDQQQKTTSKIPILGSIPILGVPFRQEHNVIKKNELVIFITPHLVTGELDLKTPSPEMLDYLDRLQEEMEAASGEEDLPEAPIKVEPIRKGSRGRQNFTHR